MTTPVLALNEDHHVHSRFSDGKHTLLQNVQRAQALDLVQLACVDHVRKDTLWLPEFVEAIGEISSETSLRLIACVEAKILNAAGDLDMPTQLHGIERVYAADHQFPLASGCCPPQVVRDLMAERAMTALEVIESLIRTLQRVMLRYPGVVIAHLFSILPKLRLHESQVPVYLLEQLAETAHRSKAIIEVDERWRCPSLRTLSYFSRRNVAIVASSDAHCRKSIGQYEYVTEMSRSLGARQ